MVKQATVTRGKEASKDKPKFKCKICHQEHPVVHCKQIPTELDEVEPLFKLLHLCLKCGKNLREGSEHTCMEGDYDKYVCQEHQWNKRFYCNNVNIVDVRSQVCKVSAGSEMLQGDSILGLEKISMSGVSILALYDMGSSHQSCRHICKKSRKSRLDYQQWIRANSFGQKVEFCP